MPRPEDDAERTGVDVASSVGFDAWREAISSAFVPLDATPVTRAGEFRGALDSIAIGDLQLSDVIGDRSRVRRSERMIRRADPGVIKVGVQLRGHSTVHQRGRYATLGPGDLAVYDTSVEYDLHLEDSFDMLVAVIPRRSLRVADRELADATARTVGTGVGTGALLRPLLMSLRAGASDAGMVGGLVEDAVADLVSAVIRSSAPIDSLGAGETVLLSARAYIEAHLHDANLSPTSVAAHHHVSVRQLQKLFAYDGQTVATFIRQRRLDRCRRDLADVAQQHRSIGAICASNGLVDASHFSRLFKQTYGESPRRFRDSQLIADL
ncbi:helix-turn-helix domain-containing protein [Gordonia soli]|uniref:Putative AraC family transcriptional regulator n=1 Tax=Gordonia soli NBRC 108243 TaxID=1223545 RepID=M0QGK3_9ACTN|nr:helix-turn-helix domain-containing protein [Gordonia soli]GAC67411.1 putative AraC family transcriptional regulator [Gordonia soli NBRC 108243]